MEMINRSLKFVLMGGVCIAGLWLSRAEADTASNLLSSGKYMVNVAPPFNADVASHIQETIAKVPGIDSVTVKPGDSAIHFTVKENTQVDPSRLRDALETVDAGAVMDTPILEHSLSTNPGL